MDNIKGAITGGIITLIIGGTAFTFSQQDVVNNFASETGLTQEQAEQYVNSIPEEELVSWEELGSALVDESKETHVLGADIDCDNYEYEWESATLTCSQGKAQLQRIANTEQSLGQAFLKLDSDSASEEDMRMTIELLDQMNAAYQLEIGRAVFESDALDEIIMTNTYNKSILKAALESS
jgi:hypothetical protein